MTKLDYIRLYAEELRKDSSLFKQHKEFIEPQLNASNSLFKNTFSNKKEARKYLRKRGLL